MLTGVTGKKFPQKFHDLLSTVENSDLDHILSWQPHGRCFKIHDPDEFIKRVVPTYYEKDKSKQPKFSSILRNLNLWGFTRLQTGMDKGCYYHEFFVRDHRSLCQYISRKAVNGRKVRRKASDIIEPNFYAKNRWQRCYFNGNGNEGDLNEKDHKGTDKEDDEGRKFIHLPQLQRLRGQRHPQEAYSRSASSLPNETLSATMMNAPSPVYNPEYESESCEYSQYSNSSFGFQLGDIHSSNVVQQGIISAPTSPSPSSSTRPQIERGDARNGAGDSFCNCPFNSRFQKNPSENQSDLHTSTQRTGVEQKGKVTPTFPFSFENERGDENEHDNSELDFAFAQEDDHNMSHRESYQTGTDPSPVTSSKLSDPNIVSIDSSDNMDCFGPEEVKKLFNALF